MPKPPISVLPRFRKKSSLAQAVGLNRRTPGLRGAMIRLTGFFSTAGSGLANCGWLTNAGWFAGGGSVWVCVVIFVLLKAWAFPVFLAGFAQAFTALGAPNHARFTGEVPTDSALRQAAGTGGFVADPAKGGAVPAEGLFARVAVVLVVLVHCAPAFVAGHAEPAGQADVRGVGVVGGEDSIDQVEEVADSPTDKGSSDGCGGFALAHVLIADVGMRDRIVAPGRVRVHCDDGDR